MRYDTSECPGVKATRLDDGRLQVENGANRPFSVLNGGGVVIIAPGASKVIQIKGDTFAMGWHYSDQERRAAGEFERVDPEGPVLGEVAGPINNHPLHDEVEATATPPVLLGSSVQPSTFPDVLVDMTPDTEADLELFGPRPLADRVVLADGPLPKARELYRELQLGDVVAHAHGSDQLAAEHWNDLAEPAREIYISAALADLRGRAAASLDPSAAWPFPDKPSVLDLDLTDPAA